LVSLLPLRKGTRQNPAITLPMGHKKLTGIAADVIGNCAYGVFQRDQEFIDKSIGIAGEPLPLAQSPPL
jgi:hypothetical protein